MAGPVSHIAYSDYFVRSYFHSLSDVEKNSFIAGSLFPDIVRLLPEAQRGVTHDRYPVDLNFRGIDYFHAGWKFHIYCDKAREYFLKANGFYEISHAKDCGYAANKLLEDILTWNSSVCRRNFPEYLRSINRSCGLADGKVVNKWYCLLVDYIETQPTYQKIEVLLRELMTSSEDTEVALKAIKILEKNQDAVRSLSLVCGNIMALKKERELLLQLS